MGDPLLISSMVLVSLAAPSPLPRGVWGEESALGCPAHAEKTPLSGTPGTEAFSPPSFQISAWQSLCGRHGLVLVKILKTSPV